MWDNTLLWVTTDNGGMAQYQDGFPASASSNFPLRAGKATLFEGGVRGISFVSGGLLPSAASGRQVTGLLQHVDIPTTLAALGGAKLPEADGYDMWKVVAEGAASPRTEVPVNVDPLNCTGANGSFDALISGDWKLISGSAGLYDGWWSNGNYSREQPSSSAAEVMIGGKSVWLFNLANDPNERENVALTQPAVVERLGRRLIELADPTHGFCPPQENTPQPASLPLLHGGVWAPFKKDLHSVSMV